MRNDNYNRIMKNISRREANNKIMIESNAMLDTYRLMKSVQLCLGGKYDYTRYSRLKTLTEESFSKESGDLRLAVRALSGLVDDQNKWMKSCILSCAVPMISKIDIQSAVRMSIYSGNEEFEIFKSFIDVLDPNWLNTSDIIWNKSYKRFETDNPIYEADAFIRTKLVEICEWIMSESTINEKFFHE